MAQTAILPSLAVTVQADCKSSVIDAMTGSANAIQSAAASASFFISLSW